MIIDSEPLFAGYTYGTPWNQDWPFYMFKVAGTSSPAEMDELCSSSPFSGVTCGWRVITTYAFTNGVGPNLEVDHREQRGFLGSGDSGTPLFSWTGETEHIYIAAFNRAGDATSISACEGRPTPGRVCTWSQSAPRVDGVLQAYGVALMTWLDS